MSQLYLLPANGMHFTAYDSIFTPLGNRLKPIIYPPLKNPELVIPNRLSWDYFLDSIQQEITGNGNIGIGHSLGGTLLLRHAIDNPDAWASIIIIEPAIFSPLIRRMYHVIRWLRLEYLTHPMIRVTKHRREQFDSPESVFKRWRSNITFQHISDKNLTDFINATIQQVGDKYYLRFPKQWEIEIYRGMCSLDPYIWANCHKIKSKLIVLAAESSNTFLNGARKRLKKVSDEFLVIPNTTHLLPFEAPQIVQKVIHRHLN